MARRIVVPTILGIVACAILGGLGLWQVQRLHWKQALLDDIAARMAAEPTALPARPDETRDRFLQVRMDGRLLPEELHVLTTRRPHGPGFKVVSPFELADGRRILIDRGYVPERLKEPSSRPFASPARVAISGTLFWPGETDGFTPEPNPVRNIWFSRDIDAMARTLGTRPVLVSLSVPLTGPWPKPFPVAHNIPNNHRAYAVTWFALAVVWAGMTAVWVRSILRRKGVAPKD